MSTARPRVSRLSRVGRPLRISRLSRVKRQSRLSRPSRVNRLSTSAGALTLSCVLLGACGGSGGKAGTTHTTTTSKSPTTTATTPLAVEPPPSRETSPGVVHASLGGVSATMHASTHHPRVNLLWPVSFTVTTNGKPAEAKVRYEYLFASAVVAHRSNYTFTGSFHDTFDWPASAVGYPLTFRAVITADGATLNLDYSVQVVS